MYYERAIQNPRHWAKAWIDRREHRVIPAYERKVLEWDLENIVCSEVDRARLLSHRPEARIHVIPNMVDVEEFHPRKRTDSTEPRLLFTGTLYYLPNIDGLLWLQREVMPLLKNPVPRVKVLGFGATSELDPVKNDPQFQFEGYVENMAEHLDQGDLYLCPLRVGAGVRFKLLEAFSAGMATISTTLGYEGIPCTPGEHLLVADTPEEFAEAIARLLADPLERERIGNNAREFVLERYSVEAAGRALEAVYSQAAR
jgi:glycosyltransferase involved in cell wall biosynthesis